MYTAVTYPLPSSLFDLGHTPLDRRPYNITLRGRRLCEIGQCTKYARPPRHTNVGRVSSAFQFFQACSLYADIPRYSSARTIRNERRYPRSTFRGSRNKPIKAFASSSNIIVIHVKRKTLTVFQFISCVLLSINSLRYRIDIFARYIAALILVKFFANS